MGAVPVRKDDEVTVVRGTYKVYVPDRWTVGPLLTFRVPHSKFVSHQTVSAPAPALH